VGFDAALGRDTERAESSGRRANRVFVGHVASALLSFLSNA
jgi:hypothetical protein